MKITLCGSARFEREFKEANKVLSLDGHVVHTLSIYPSDEGGKEWYSQDEKEMLDKVYLLKIECSDAILVISPGGYIGESTRREIEHAERLGKEVFYSISDIRARTKEESQ